MTNFLYYLFIISDILPSPFPSPSSWVYWQSGAQEQENSNTLVFLGAKLCESLMAEIVENTAPKYAPEFCQLISERFLR